MSFSATNVDAAIKHLRAADPVMRNLIREVGPFTLRPTRDRFAMLVRSIISQQISTNAARTIRTRLEECAKPERLTPERIVRFSLVELRSVGLSSQKASYVLDLSRHVLEGRVRLRQIGRHNDEQVIQQLTQVKGIGRWTAEMFLIFALGRLDVFPCDDLGIRSALRNLYELDDPPDKETCHRIAQPWRPYATVASWYCWRSVDAKPNTAAEARQYPV